MFNPSAFTLFLATLGLAPAGIKPDPPFMRDSATPLQANLATSFASSNNSVSASGLTPCIVTPYVSIPPGAPKFAPFDRKAATVYRYRQQQSVNLGSW